MHLRSESQENMLCYREIIQVRQTAYMSRGLSRGNIQLRQEQGLLSLTHSAMKITCHSEELNYFMFLYQGEHCQIHHWSERTEWHCYMD